MNTGPLAFLDTNTLHFVDSYLRYSSTERLNPASDHDKRALEMSLTRVEDQALRRSIRSGMKTIDWLLLRDLRVVYSPVSELELISGRVRGSALLNAAREGIPDRMWTRVSDADVQRRVAAEELRAIGGRVVELSSQLDTLGISALRASERASEVWELARSLAELIYLSPNDGIIYAGALSAQAEYLITSDEYLRKTVNGIRSSDRTRFREVRRRLRNVADDVFLEAATEVILPAAVAPARLGDTSST